MPELLFGRSHQLKHGPFRSLPLTSLLDAPHRICGRVAGLPRALLLGPVGQHLIRSRPGRKRLRCTRSSMPEGSLQRRNAGTRAGCQVPDPLHLLLMDAQQVPTLARIQCRLQHDALQRAATPARV